MSFSARPGPDLLGALSQGKVLLSEAANQVSALLLELLSHIPERPRLSLTFAHLSFELLNPRGARATLLLGAWLFRLLGGSALAEQATCAGWHARRGYGRTFGAGTGCLQHGRSVKQGRRLEHVITRRADQLVEPARVRRADGN